MLKPFLLEKQTTHLSFVSIVLVINLTKNYSPNAFKLITTIMSQKKFTSLSKEDYAGKGGIGSQPKMKSNQKKMPLVSSASVATANIFWTTEAASFGAKDPRQAQKKIEHFKGLLTVSAKMSPLKSSFD